MSDSEDADDVLGGLSHPVLNAGAAAPESDDESGDERAEPTAGAPEDEAATGDAEADDDADDAAADSRLLGAEAAFETTEGSELDPFRVASGVDPAPAEPSWPAAEARSRPGGGDARKLFVGGLSHATDEASLTKFFARFGKVQECHVARTEGGKHRGFGFVTFVSHKGSAFAVKEAGDPPEMMVDGRKCNVRYTEDRGPDLRGVNTNALPARGAGFLTKQKAPAAFGASSSGGGGGGGGGGQERRRRRGDARARRRGARAGAAADARRGRRRRRRRRRRGGRRQAEARRQEEGGDCDGDAPPRRRAAQQAADHDARDLPEGVLEGVSGAIYRRLSSAR